MLVLQYSNYLHDMPFVVNIIGVKGISFWIEDFVLVIYFVLYSDTIKLGEIIIILFTRNQFSPVNTANIKWNKIRNTWGEKR